MGKTLMKKTTITEEFVAVPDKKGRAKEDLDVELEESLGDLGDMDDDADCDEDDLEQPSSRSRGRRTR